ncbi:MAG: TatD family hydrolase [Arenicella sp.]|nr:TatD family hydrolase [Arenicella sp.]
MIDTHCHLDFQEFDQDRDAVLQRCADNGVNRIVVPAVSAACFKRTINTCIRYPSLELALGLHPIFIEQRQPQHLVELDQLITQYSPIAVGEIGLDFFENRLIRENLKEKQIAFFAKQIIIAKQHDLPLIIHNRKAHDECLQLLAAQPLRGGIIHAFNGSVQQAQKYIALGFVLGFGGMLTFDRSRKLRRLAEQIPLHAIVLETDAPDMTVSQHQGQRNSPEYLHYVQQVLADIKGCSLETIAETTSATAKRVLRL